MMFTTVLVSFPPSSAFHEVGRPVPPMCGHKVGGNKFEGFVFMAYALIGLS
jgi:hypothetical protein